MNERSPTGRSATGPGLKKSPAAEGLARVSRRVRLLPKTARAGDLGTQGAHAGDGRAVQLDVAIGHRARADDTDGQSPAMVSGVPSRQYSRAPDRAVPQCPAAPQTKEGPASVGSTPSPPQPAGHPRGPGPSCVASDRVVARLRSGTQPGRTPVGLRGRHRIGQHPVGRSQPHSSSRPLRHTTAASLPTSGTRLSQVHRSVLTPSCVTLL